MSFHTNSANANSCAISSPTNDQRHLRQTPRQYTVRSEESMWVVEDDNQEQGTVVITLDKIKKTWW